MPGSSADVVSERSGGTPQFQDAELKVGAVYAIGVETAAARLPLLLAPLQAALQVGRPCVLVTRLSPEEAPFADVLARASQMIESSCGSCSDRLQVFTAVGDYSVNLFLHGADRYLQELDQFAIAPGSMLVIDEADDLYTPHDHSAVVEQAKAYQAWCAKHQHTMVQLHLRTSPHHPLLEGNQAAAQYLSGVARAISHPDGLRVVIDYWESSAGMLTGLSIPLNPLLPSCGVAPAVNAAASTFRVEPDSLLAASASERPSLWYVGPPGSDLGAWSRQFDVHTAPSMAELLPWRHSCECPIIIVTLGSLDGFTGFVEQLAELRATAGNRARIVVRESRYRLREHTQKRLLLRAGVDSVLAPSQSLADLAPVLLQPRSQPVAVVTDADLYAAVPWVLDAPDGDPESLGSSAFVDEAERRLKRSMSWCVPCALAEVDYEVPQAPDPANGMKGVPHTRRAGDLITGKPGTQYFFLQGCHVHDAMHVVMRCMEALPRPRLQRIRLYTSEMAIADRFLQLRNEAIADAVLANVSHGKTGTNVVNMPANGRFGHSWGHFNMVWIAGLLLTVACAEALAQAGPAAADAAPVAAAASVSYEQGRYGQAARQGLIELEREPRDHVLRLKVANSLAWTGQYREAIRQYELLADTPGANSATIGLANVYLWSGRPHLADPLFRRALDVEPSSADAQQGLARAQRQLRPRTTLRGEWLDDSGQTERATAMLAHRWRDAGLMQIFEVSGERVDETRSPDGLALRPRKLSFGYQNVGWPLAPKLQLTSDTGVKSSVFGNLALQLADGAMTLELGRVNWGEIAFDPRARRDGLSAGRLGLAGRFDASVGSFAGSATHFAISDGNRMQEYNAQYTPAWQPLPAASGVRVLAGVYGRKAKVHDPRYWSPASGYYIGQLGLSLNRSADDWDLSGEVKRGLRIGGEGAQGWTLGFAGTRWLTSRWALRLEGFHIETRRDNSAYRAKSVAVSLDRVW